MKALNLLMYKGLTQSYKVHLNYHIIIFFMLEKIKKNLGNKLLALFLKMKLIKVRADTALLD